MMRLLWPITSSSKIIICWGSVGFTENYFHCQFSVSKLRSVSWNQARVQVMSEKTWFDGFDFCLVHCASAMMKSTKKFISLFQLQFWSFNCLAFRMFRVLYSLFLIPAWSLVIIKQINYNINKEYVNVSFNFTVTKEGPIFLANFTIFNDIPKCWVILTDSIV